MNTAPLKAAELLYGRALQMGLQPSWLTHGGLFAIITNGGEQYINSARCSLNSHVSISLAKNKYLTRLILARHNLPNIPFARPKTLAEAEAFLIEHGKIIVKPVRGLGAQDIHIVDDMQQLAGMNIKHYIFEKYIAGIEVRYLVLDDTVISVHESRYGTSVAADRALERISYPETEWDAALADMSVHIASILGLKFAAIDYLIDHTGTAHILEVNTTPGFKWFHAPSSGPSVDVAGLFLEALLRQNNQHSVPVLL